MYYLCVVKQNTNTMNTRSNTAREIEVRMKMAQIDTIEVYGNDEVWPSPLDKTISGASCYLAAVTLEDEKVVTYWYRYDGRGAEVRVSEESTKWQQGLGAAVKRYLNDQNLYTL